MGFQTMIENNIVEFYKLVLHKQGYRHRSIIKKILKYIGNPKYNQCNRHGVLRLLTHPPRESLMNDYHKRIATLVAPEIARCVFNDKVIAKKKHFENFFLDRTVSFVWKENAERYLNALCCSSHSDGTPRHYFMSLTPRLKKFYLQAIGEVLRMYFESYFTNIQEIEEVSVNDDLQVQLNGIKYKRN